MSISSDGIEFRWITNSPCDETSYLTRQWTLQGLKFRILHPKATARYTTEELLKMGYNGLYIESNALFSRFRGKLK